jgi:hypothetical protein
MGPKKGGGDKKAISISSHSKTPLSENTFGDEANRAPAANKAKSNLLILTRGYVTPQRPIQLRLNSSCPGFNLFLKQICFPF